MELRDGTIAKDTAGSSTSDHPATIHGEGSQDAMLDDSEFQEPTEMAARLSQIATIDDTDLDESGSSSEDESKSEAEIGGMEEEGSGGFFVDFEEIEADEDVERLISQNHTPAASTRQSPVAMRGVERIAGEEHKTAAAGHSSDDEEFESIPALDGSEQAVGGVAETTVLDRMQQDFRDRHVPKVAQGRFFDVEVYKRYTVVKAQPAAVSEPKEAGPTAAAPAVSTVHHHQKPSSLRSHGAAGAGSEVPKETAGGNSTGSEDVQGAAKTRAVASEGDDVVGALLGAMKSPGLAKAGTEAMVSRMRQASPLAHVGEAAAVEAGNEKPGEVPNDLLVAMQAIEGTAPAVAPEQQQQQPAAGDSGKTAKELAALLPREYSGPFSQLTAAEHVWYLKQTHRAKAGETLTHKEMQELSRLRGRVETEQQRFRQQSREAVAPRLGFISTAVKQWAAAELERQRARALAIYGRRYRAVHVTPIRPTTPGYVQFEYSDTLLQRGTCARVAWEQVSGGDIAQADPWVDGAVAPAMSQDACAMQLAGLARADVSLTLGALEALLTLAQAFARDVMIPFEIRETDGRRVLVVDSPLASAQAATPRMLNQEFYEAATAARAVSGASADMDLRRGSMLGRVEGGSEAESGNASYTLWEFGGLRVLVRSRVHGFATGEGGRVATVTLKTKLEYQRGLGAAGEEVTETERLAWWLGSYMRGSPSEVWVTHVDVGAGQAVRATRVGSGDLYECTSPGTSPSTRGVRELLRELLGLAAGQYMLVHRKRTWDATVYRAADDAGGPGGAVLDLGAELAGGSEPTLEADIDSDYVAGAWQAAVPGQIPNTYPPADLAEWVQAEQQAGSAKPRGGKRRRGGSGRSRSKRSKR